MKTKTLTLLMLAMLVVATGSAIELPKLNVVQADEKKALVVYRAPFSAPLEVTVYGEKAEILYYKRIKEAIADYRKVFNFSKLGNGDYTVWIDYGNKGVCQKLSVRDDKMEFSPVEQMHDPVYVMKGNKLDITVLNNHVKPVTLEIYKEHRLVSDVLLGDEFAINKRLNLKNLESGKYNVIISDQYKKYSFSVRK